MESKLVIYNTLTRQKERFEPLHAPNVGMYVCGMSVVPLSMATPIWAMPVLPSPSTCCSVI